MALACPQGANVPIRMRAHPHEVESAALDQLTRIAALPWTFRHVAVMPDVRGGKGAEIGSAAVGHPRWGYRTTPIYPTGTTASMSGSPGILEEIPGAYQDLDQVMANRTDLVEVAARLRQVLCVKG